MNIGSQLEPIKEAAEQPQQKFRSYDRLMFRLAIAYGAAVSVYVIWHRTFLSPDQFLVIGMLAALMLGRAKAFLRDWIPLILLLFGYEYIRGLVETINQSVHILPMIQFDRLVFGTVPTVELQTRFYTPGQPQWYDYAAVVLYLLHFVVPLTVAFIFWVQNARIFKQYSAAMVILSYITYFTYLAFPAAPPWMAAQAGFLPPVTKIMDATFSDLSTQIQLPSIYRLCGVNLVAAVPSLHAAYPLLTALFVGRKAPKLIPVMALYVVSVWVAVVYLGEHYAFDVFVGMIYALFTYGAVKYWPNMKSRMRKSRNVRTGALATWQPF
jgi:hypothetical protein